jgi:hypothetical protein
MQTVNRDFVARRAVQIAASKANKKLVKKAKTDSTMVVLVPKE